jgi:hypothetical protein
MAKKLIAVTNVKHDGVWYDAGSELDPAMFEKKDDLKKLWDMGAVSVEDAEEAPTVQTTSEVDQTVSSKNEEPNTDTEE